MLTNTWSTFCLPLADLKWDVLDQLRNDLETELNDLEANVQPTAELSLGLIALQLLQSLFLRLTRHQAKQHLAVLESEETAQRAAHLVEGTGLLRVSLTSANIMSLTLQLRGQMSKTASTSQSTAMTTQEGDDTSPSASPSPSYIPPSVSSSSSSPVPTPTSTSTTEALAELTMTPYAACLLEDDVDVRTTQEDLDREDRHRAAEKIEYDNMIMYGNGDIDGENNGGIDGSFSASAQFGSITPHQTPTSTPGGPHTVGSMSESETMVQRRIRQFERGGRASPPPPSPMRGTSGLIGIDRHLPTQYPRPGQWMSPHHRAVSDDKRQALERDYVGLDIATHGKNLSAYKGTGDFLPMARWLGSLRNNAEYRKHLEGAPPGVAESVGVRMVQPPMHYTAGADSKRSRRHNAVNSGDEKEMMLLSQTAYDEVSRSILSDGATGRGGGGTSGSGTPSSVSPEDVIHRGSRIPSKISMERRARRKRAERAIAECGGKIGIDHHEPSLYPLPGQHVSRYHRGRGNDKARALARPYVGMNMNHMRRHIATGNGDGRAASNWIGSLRCKAKGADGGYMEYMRGVEERKTMRDETEMNGNRDGSGTDNREKREGKEDKKREDGDDLDVSTELTRGKRNPDKRSKHGKTQYMGNKTQAQMDGVPVNMRWKKPNEFGDTTRGYLRMKERLYRGSIREVAGKWRLRGETPDHRTWMRSSDDLTSKRSAEEERRRRRMEYGNAYAKRFKRKKKIGGWVD